jgi:phage terminase small subunit
MLNDKQRKFCEEYVLDFNGTQAAIRAGYSKKTANRIASENLLKPDIQNYLSELKKKVAEESDITKKQLIDELSKIAFFDIRKIFNDDNSLRPITDFDDESAAAVSSIENDEIKEWNPVTEEKELIGYTKKVKIHNKISAIERISKMLGYDSPTKVAQTDTKGNDVPKPKYDKLTTEELNMLLLLEKKAVCE